MAGRKKSGKITLRMDSETHARVARTAQALGMDMNGLLNLLIRTQLVHYEVMALEARDPKRRAAVKQRIDALAKLVVTVNELVMPAKGAKVAELEAELAKVEKVVTQLDELTALMPPPSAADPAEGEQPQQERVEP